MYKCSSFPVGLKLREGFDEFEGSDWESWLGGVVLGVGGCVGVGVNWNKDIVRGENSERECIEMGKCLSFFE